MHRRYEELCGLAATGQINAGDGADLQEHLSTCSECRAFLDDVVQVGMQGAPVVAASQAVRADIQPPLGIRARFLDRAAAAGQENRSAWVRPFSLNSVSRDGDVSRFSIASRSSIRLRGSISTAAPPVISGSDETPDVITGTPAAMACATGNPNPS